MHTSDNWLSVRSTHGDRKAETSTYSGASCDAQALDTAFKTALEALLLRGPTSKAVALAALARCGAAAFMDEVNGLAGPEHLGGIAAVVEAVHGPIIAVMCGGNCSVGGS